MDAAAGVLTAALADAPGDLEARAELAETWNQLAQVLDRRVCAHEEAEEEPDAEAGTESGATPGSGPVEPLSAAELEALRLEEVRLWERAAALHAELGPDHLEARYQCVNNAAWTERELGRPEAGAARVSALADEVRELPEGTAPQWLLQSAERTAEHLLRAAS